MQTAKTTMSVREMGQMLGLKKTDAYWLVHRNLFQVVTVNGKMRIDIQSFERWYANQTRYHKVDGPPPGEVLRAGSYSAEDICELLDLQSAAVYELIRREGIETVELSGKMWIPKDEFNRWYSTQTRYRLPEDRERDREMEEATLSLPEIARILGVHRNSVYGLLQRNPDAFEIVVIADRKRVTKASFERWYASRKRYGNGSDHGRNDSDCGGNGSPPAEPTMIDRNKSAYSVQETAVLLGISVRSVYTLIRDGALDAKRYGHVFRILRGEIEWQLLQYQIETREDETWQA